MKETNLNSEKFTLGVKLATEFIPALRFYVQTSVKLQIDSKVRSPSWIFELSHAHVISVGHEGDQLNSEKFIIYVKKAAAFIPALRFYVQTSVKLQIDSKVRSPSWIFELSHAHVISVGHEGDQFKF